MPAYWWLIPITSLIAAAFGAGAAFAGLVWRYRADNRRDIFRELLVTIQSAADLATEYWLLDPSQDAAAVDKCQNLKARIIGYSERLEASIDAARPHMKRIDTLGMEIPWAKLMDGLTGGAFGETTRSQDTDRAEAVQVAAANLIRELRLAVDRALLAQGASRQ